VLAQPATHKQINCTSLIYVTVYSFGLFSDVFTFIGVAQSRLAESGATLRYRRLSPASPRLDPPGQTIWDLW